MWPHRQIDWFAIGIGLILAFPVGVTANLFTPALRNWWAGRSRKSVARRIAYLSASLSKAESLPMLSETEDKILKSGEATHYLIWITGTFVIIAMMATGLVGSRLMFPNYYRRKSLEFTALVVLCNAVWTVFYVKYAFPLAMYRAHRSAEDRQKIRDMISKLQEKLAKF